ncbi:MAG: DUF72 domain-containing protein [Actinomycetota bacterium]
MAGRARVGTAAWKKPTWRGTFYPPGLVQRRELEFASSQLSTLEINATFRGDQSAATFASWREQTPADFVFSMKASKTVVQLYRAANTDIRIDQFFATGTYELGSKLGPVLWQFQAGVPYNEVAFLRFLRALPTGVRHCVEARDPSFEVPGFLELAADFAVAVALTNDPAQPTFDAISADFVYIRLSADDERYRDGYDDATLDAWASRIRDRQQHGDVFVYFTHKDDAGAHTPFDAMKLQERLD